MFARDECTSMEEVIDGHQTESFPTELSRRHMNMGGAVSVALTGLSSAAVASQSRDAFFNRLHLFIDYNSGGSIDGMIAARQCGVYRTINAGRPWSLVVSSSNDILTFDQVLVEVRNKVTTLRSNGAAT